jgi:hypothetical protein
MALQGMAPQGMAPQGVAPPGNPPWAGAAAVPPAWNHRTPGPELTDPNAPANVPTTASAVMAPPDADQIAASAPRTLSGFLVAFDANPLGEFWPLHQGQSTVGRKGSSTDITIPIDHPTTSSRHAKLYVAARPGRLKVEDLGSTNGTYVNERRLEPNERRSVEHGDTLRFGGFSVCVVLV